MPATAPLQILSGLVACTVVLLLLLPFLILVRVIYVAQRSYRRDWRRTSPYLFALSAALNDLFVLPTRVYVWCWTVASVALPRNEYLEEEVRSYLTPIFEKYSTPLQGTAAYQFRGDFQRLPIPWQPSMKDHTHGEDACTRSRATSFMQLMSQTHGKTLHMEEMSAADQRKSMRGTRVYRWAKDLNAKASSRLVDDRDMVGIVDVDYYINMEEYLAEVRLPTILYTLIPDTVAGVCNDACFHFNAKGQVDMQIPGGARFVHQLWDFGTDCLTVSHNGATVVYLVDRRAAGMHRYLVLLTPLRIFFDSAASLANRWLEHHRLARLNPVKGRYAMLRTIKNHSPGVSFGLAGSDLHVELPSETFRALEVVASTSGTPITLGTVESFLPREDATRVKAAALLEYLREKTPMTAPIVYPLAESTYRYQFGTPEPEAPQMMVPFMAPLVKGCFIPDNTASTEKQSAESRVMNPKTSAQPSARTTQFAQEFIELLVPTPHTLHPISYEEVIERQQRPGQVSIIVETAGQGDNRDERSTFFVKKEPYQKVADPRGIFDFRGDPKCGHGRYIYPAADRIKDGTRWYSFGLTPRCQAERVARICQRSRMVNQSDGSRWDMHVSEVFRLFEVALMMRLFHPRHHEDMKAQMEKQHHRKHAGRLGNKLWSEWQRCSGTMETGFFNTVDNAFMAYIGYRLSGLDRDDAWQQLLEKGFYGGDDALSGDLPEEYSRQAAKMVGQVLEVDIVKFGDFGVNFLARHYSREVWYGDPTSCASPLRQLSKFHVTAHLPGNVTPVEKCWQKCKSYACSDRGTPILGDFVLHFLSLCEKEGKEFGADKHRLRHYYKANEDLSEQYPNVRADWMFDMLRAEMPGLDVKFAVDRIYNCKTTAELLELPCFYEVPVKPHPTKDVTMMNGQAPGLLPTPTPSETVNKATPAKRACETRAQQATALKKVQTPSPTAEKQNPSLSAAPAEQPKPAKAAKPASAKSGPKQPNAGPKPPNGGAGT